MTAPRGAFYAGVDGGATKTFCLVSSERGEVMGLGRAGPSNFHNIGLGAALSNLRLAFDSACDSARIDQGRIAVACFGLAGLDSPQDERILGRAIGQEFPESVRIVHDSQMAVAAALGGRPGVVVNAGTGSVAGGSDIRGGQIRVGGWGNIIGDEGSAYSIGRRALQVCMQAYDGRGQSTRLLRLVMKRLGVHSPPGIIEAVYVKKMTVSEVASLSALVTEAAGKGDQVAAGLLHEAGRDLAWMAVTTARRLGLDAARHVVATVGSVFSSRFVKAAFDSSLRDLAPLSVRVPPAFPQVFGAVLISMMRREKELEPRVIKSLARGMRRLPRSVVPDPRAFRPPA